MSAPLAFLRFVAKAALNHIGAGFAGDFAFDVLPEIARDVWQWWAKDRPECQLRDELEEVAQLTDTEAHRQAEQAVTEVAAQLPEKQRRELSVYLSLIPGAIRQSQRRPSDPTGRTVAPCLSLQQTEGMLTFLPTRIPRFESGAKPPGAADWALEELLGIGGFGEVWRASNPHLGEQAAFKFCLDPAAAETLRNEADLLRRVGLQGEHPGIVQLLDTSLNSDPPWLKYEFVNGGELTGIIREAQPRRGLPPRDAALIIQEVSEAVGFAHRLNPPIIHRDLKPANVLVQYSADGRRAYRVADFGIGGVATRQAISQTQMRVNSCQSLVSSVRGAYTPLYAPPQQMRGDPPDPRDDVYALGVIWYQLLTGDLRVGSPSGGAWKRRLQDKGTSAPMVELLESCFECDPEDRPPDAADLSERLRAILSPPPPSAIRAEQDAPSGTTGTRVIIQASGASGVQAEAPLTVEVTPPRPPPINAAQAIMAMLTTEPQTEDQLVQAARKAYPGLLANTNYATDAYRHSGGCPKLRQAANAGTVGRDRATRPYRYYSL